MSASPVAGPPHIAKVVAELSALLGDRLTTSADERAHHGRDESYHAPHAPDAVAFAQSTDEVAAIVGLCARYKAPVIAFGSLQGRAGFAQPSSMAVGARLPS